MSDHEPETTVKRSAASAADQTAGRSATRRFVAATLIDALGSGLWMPFGLLFLVNAQNMSLTAAGASLSLGALFGLAAVRIADGPGRL